MIGKTFVDNVYGLAGMKPTKKQTCLNFGYGPSEKKTGIEARLYKDHLHLQPKYEERDWDNMVTIHFRPGNDGGTTQPRICDSIDVEYGEILFVLYVNEDEGDDIQILRLANLVSAVGCLPVVHSFITSAAGQGKDGDFTYNDT